MDNFVVKAIILLALPVVVFTGGIYVMAKLSGRQQVTQRLLDHAKAEDRKPLALRIGGYNLEAVNNHWGALDPDTRKLERRALEIDLIFPFFYGGALAAALLLGWATLHRPFQPAWLLAPIAIAMVSDWIENLVQLAQLRLFDASGGAGLQSGWIQIASGATFMKWAFSAVASLLVVGFFVWILACGLARRS